VHRQLIRWLERAGIRKLAADEPSSAAVADGDHAGHREGAA
jgi:hypothetical protein